MTFEKAKVGHKIHIQKVSSMEWLKIRWIEMIQTINLFTHKVLNSEEKLSAIIHTNCFPSSLIFTQIPCVPIRLGKIRIPHTQQFLL